LTPFFNVKVMGWPGNVIETHEHSGDFKEPIYNLNSGALGVGKSQ